MDFNITFGPRKIKVWLYIYTFFHDIRKNFENKIFFITAAFISDMSWRILKT